MVVTEEGFILQLFDPVKKSFAFSDIFSWCVEVRQTQKLMYSNQFIKKADITSAVCHICLFFPVSMTGELKRNFSSFFLKRQDTEQGST